VVSEQLKQRCIKLQAARAAILVTSLRFESQPRHLHQRGWCHKRSQWAPHIELPAMPRLPATRRSAGASTISADPIPTSVHCSSIDLVWHVVSTLHLGVRLTIYVQESSKVFYWWLAGREYSVSNIPSSLYHRGAAP
jgi:hypothetical protein